MNTLSRTMPSSSKKQAVKEAEARQEAALLAQLELAAFGDTPTNKDGGQLSEPETWWSKHYNWLKDNGYILRARYSPDWTPSWQGTKKSWLMCEDSRVAKVWIKILGTLSRVIHPLEIASTLLGSSMVHVLRTTLL